MQQGGDRGAAGLSTTRKLVETRIIPMNHPRTMAVSRSSTSSRLPRWTCRRSPWHRGPRRRGTFHRTGGAATARVTAADAGGAVRDRRRRRRQGAGRPRPGRPARPGTGCGTCRWRCCAAGGGRNPTEVLVAAKGTSKLGSEAAALTAPSMLKQLILTARSLRLRRSHAKACRQSLLPHPLVTSTRDIQACPR